MARFNLPTHTLNRPQDRVSIKHWEIGSTIINMVDNTAWPLSSSVIFILVMKVRLYNSATVLDLPVLLFQMNLTSLVQATQTYIFTHDIHT